MNVTRREKTGVNNATKGPSGPAKNKLNESKKRLHVCTKPSASGEN
jgi:hypothetical protein